MFRDKKIDKTGRTDHKSYWHHISESLTVNDPADVDPVKQFNMAVSVLLKNSRKSKKAGIGQADKRLYT